MKRYSVYLTRSAQKDIDISRNFYESQSPGLGEYFYDSIIADLDSLKFMAGIHPIHFGFHRKLASRFPFTIYYEIENDRRVIVHALFHTRKKIPPQLSRR
jgi:plasmid stabilization system protein ParE